MSKTIRAAAAQLPGLPMASAKDSLGLIEEAIAEASRASANLVVLPECAYPAYHLGSVEAYRSANLLSSEGFVSQLCGWAKKCAITVVCGFVEDDGNNIHNSAIVIDSTGRECGRHRKCFLWGEDNGCFVRGEHLKPIETPIGKIGVIICADARAPETATSLTKQGAEIIAVPTCWVNVASRPEDYANAQAEFMIEARALECGVPFIAANKFGSENEDLSYCGWSQIVDAKGNVLSKAAPDKADILISEIRPKTPPKQNVPDWAVRRIFSACSPEIPNQEDLGLIKIAVVPSKLVSPLKEDEHGDDLFQRLAKRSVKIVSTSLHQTDVAEDLDMYGRSLGIDVIGYPFVERLMLESFGAFGCIESAHMNSFVPARTMALDGAAIIFVVGDAVPMSLLRTRAAENRVFIAAANTDSAALIGPAGNVIAQTSRETTEPIVAEIDLRESADKYVFPNTHVWEQRQPRIYAEAFDMLHIYHD